LRNVSSTELAKITKGKQGQEKQAAPYRAIASDPCIIGIWLSTIGGSLGFQIFLLYGPTYINKVLHYDVTRTGLTTALPYILSATLKFLVGPISDRASCISDRWRLVFFAAFSQGLMALSFLALVFITSPSLAQTAYTVAIVSSGINAVGTIKCAQMVARQHVHVVMAVTSFLLCVIVLVIPLAVNIVCPDNTPEQVPSSPLVLVAPSSVQPFKSWSCLQTALLPHTISSGNEAGNFENCIPSTFLVYLSNVKRNGNGALK
ncbi:hypothetical protein COOONC_05628, partial [Cooperia oncophora]